MSLEDLFDSLEDLRIPDSDFFGVTEEKRMAYEKANDMLDDCLQIIYNYFQGRISE